MVSRITCLLDEKYFHYINRRARTQKSISKAA
jgi:hypothetical protein